MSKYPSFVTKLPNWARAAFSRDPEWTFTEELDFAVNYVLAHRFNSLPDDMQDYGRRALAERIYDVTRRPHE
jgi:hypothetical protein